MKTLYTSFALLLVLVMMLPASTTILNAEEDDQASRNKAISLEWWLLEDQHDYSQMERFFTEDVVRHSAATAAIMPDVAVNSREDYRAFLEGTAAMFPDYHGTHRVVVAEGDLVAFSFNFVGHFLPNGTILNVPMMGMYRFEDGRIAEIWVEWDNITWNTQMGPMPDIDLANERPVTSIDDLIGAWTILVDGVMWRMEYTPDEVWVGYGSSEVTRTAVISASYELEGNQVLFTDEVECTATYTAFVIMDSNGNPAALRFDLLGDECDENRREALAGQTLYPYREG